MKKKKQQIVIEKQVKNKIEIPIFSLILGGFLLYMPFMLNDLASQAKYNRFFAWVVFLVVFSIIFFYKKIEKQISISKFGMILFSIFLVFCIWSCLGSYLAFNPVEALPELNKYFIFIIFVLAVAITFCIEANSFFTVSIFITIASIIDAYVGILQYFDLGYRYLTVAFNIAPPYGFNNNMNFFGSYLALCLPFSIYLFITKQNIWKYVSALSIVLIVIAIVLTLTRAVWLSVTIGLICLFLLEYFYNQKKVTIIKNIFKPIIIGIFAISILAFADKTGKLENELIGEIIGSVNIFKGNKIETKNDELAKLSKGAEENASSRLLMWGKTIDMIKEYPIFGVGRNNYKILIGKYGLDYAKGYANGKFFPDYPHNVYLFIAAETGIIGLFSFLAFFISILYLAIVELKKKYSIDMLLPVIGLVIFSIDSLFSFPDVRIEHMAMLGLFCGIILSKTIVHSTTDRINNFYFKISNNKTLYILTSSILLFNIYFGLKLINFDYHYQNAKEFLKQKKFNEILKECSLAKSSLISVAGNITPIENYELLAHLNLNQPNEAKKAYLNAIKKSPYCSALNTNLGLVYYNLGNKDSTLLYLDKALKITSEDPYPIRFASIIKYEKGEYNLALKYLEKINLDSNTAVADVLKKITQKTVETKQFEITKKAINISKPFQINKNWFDSLENTLRILKPVYKNI